MNQATTTTKQLTDLSAPDAGKKALDRFAKDIDAGLSAYPKTLPSQYFYDARGSRLFQQIMALPEYYLTNSEQEVFESHKQTIAEILAGEAAFSLIDLGAGDATKTKILLEELLQQKANFEYIPVDISGDAMRRLTESLTVQLPALKTHAVVGDYFAALQWLKQYKPGPKVLLFLGSNIGNFSTTDERLNFLTEVRKHLQSGDKLLIGMDLRKDPDTILQAYNDASGVTAAFNLNLLERINRELDGNFKPEQFRHFALYNPQEGVMKSYLISRQEQQVTIGATGHTYTFSAWEAIHTENSYKFTLQQAEALGNSLGFKTEKVFQDKKAYFANLLYLVT